MILFLVGTGVAPPFFDTFSRLGSWGPLVGFCLALPYFAILDSAIGNGQTVGKRLMHIQGIDENGNTIPFWRSPRVMRCSQSRTSSMRCHFP